MNLIQLLIYGLTLILSLCEGLYEPVDSKQDMFISKLPLCKKQEHVEGNWIRHHIDPSTTQSIQKKSFYCCDSRTPQLNDKSVCLDEGVQIKKLFYRGNLKYSTSTSAHSCVCDFNEGIFDVHEREEYYWKPTKCDLRLWDAHLFCETLGSRSILLIGDSTMEQSASTLMSMIAVANDTCGTQIMFARCDTLIIDGYEGNQESFDKTILKHQPDIVILTMGAWCHSLEQFQNGMTEIEKKIKELHHNEALAKHPKFIWKTQNPGHRQCMNFHNPITNGEEEMLELSTRPTTYEWHLHPTFDKIAIEYFERSGFHVINMSPLYLRPDGHPGKYTSEWFANGDCLHYCLPGPLDLFSVLLLQLLYTNEI
eukprot:gene6861-9396_t